MKNIFANFINKERNIFSAFLDLLNVKHTNKYTTKYFNEHPDKYNMLGLTKMLEHYGVHATGVRTNIKEEAISEIKVPFIAHLTVDFVVVEIITKDKITYLWHGERSTIPMEEFIEVWSGAVLLAEADENSIEPEYQKHRQEELIVEIQKWLLYLGAFILFLQSFIYHKTYTNIGLIFLFIMNISGLYIGYLLVQKQMHIQSKQADKICSLFNKNSCNDVLESAAAKFMGVIGWSELGFSYFFSNTFILLFTPQFLSYLVLLNICVLPYSFWSIWYQKFKAKSWCPLCLIVQVLFWALFIIDLSFAFVQMPEFTIGNILSIGLIYGLPFLMTNLLVPQLAKVKKIERVTQELNSFKMNEKMFYGMLKEQTHYDIDRGSFKILLGNTKAKNLITVFTNPHCEPCGRMHNRIENLIKETNNYCVQYILSSFDEGLDSSCEFLLHINNNFTAQERDFIYNQWFKELKYRKESVFEKYNFVSNGTKDEYNKHKEWKNKTKLRATPTILVNGYELPNNYEIEDLLYFADLDLSSDKN